jgi:hypothetical protein
MPLSIYSNPILGELNNTCKFNDRQLLSFPQNMFWKRLLIILPVIILTYVEVFAQKKNAAFEVHIHKTAFPMIMDGSMNEDAWQQAEAADNFFMVLPMDTSLALVKTDVRVTYDDHYFYLLAVCYKDWRQ